MILPRRLRRVAARSAGIALTVLALVLAAAPAALAVDDGEQPGEALSFAENLVLFVLVPLAVFVLVAALVYLPGMTREGRYRPARGWEHEPVWFRGPSDAVEITDEDRSRAAAAARGGAGGDW